MCVNLRAILVTSGRQSDSKLVSSWKKQKHNTELRVVGVFVRFLRFFSPYKLHLFLTPLIKVIHF